MTDELAGLRWVVFQLVEHCNLRCRMCYEWGDQGAYHELSSLHELDFEVFRRVVEECVPHRPYFEFFGGEPLLHSRIADAIRLIRAADCVLAIPTNGVLLEPLAELLVDTQPTRLWISLDGPEAVNDAQRGRGVFRKVTRGMDAVHTLRTQRGRKLPELGVTYVVTPSNHTFVEPFFLRAIDLEMLDCVSIEFQNFATEDEVERYAAILKEELQIQEVTSARGYVAHPEDFVVDSAELARQVSTVKEHCQRLGIRFFSHPRTIDATNYENYFAGRWEKLSDRRTRCAFPWVYAEISARGEVTPCHSFYDHSIGNVHEHSLREIWQGERLARVRKILKRELFPICTACCRYYNNSLSSIQGGA